MILIEIFLHPFFTFDTMLSYSGPRDKATEDCIWRNEDSFYWCSFRVGHKDWIMLPKKYVWMKMTEHADPKAF